MSVFSKVKEVDVKPHGWQYKDYQGMVISPSGLRNLYDNPMTWKRNVILRERTFFGNANTVFGTIVHAFAENYYDKLLTDEYQLPKNIIEAILRYETAITMQDLDLDHLKLVCTCLRDEYLDVYPTPDEVEGYIELDYSDTIKIAGSFDCLEKNPDGTYTVIDFKTSSKSKDSMSEYVLQLSVYALLLMIKRDIVVSKLRVVLIVKTKVPKIIVLECEPNFVLAKETLQIATETIELSIKHPELNYLLFKENYFSFSSEQKMCEYTTVITAEQREKSKLKKDIFG